MPEMTDLERQAKAFAEARGALRDAVAECKAAMDEIKNGSLPVIRRRLARVVELETRLRDAVEGSPELFVKPRTVIMHGVRIGFQKAKGGVVVPDAKRTLMLIRRHLPDQAETLIKTTESVVKAALLNLSVADLKKVGCEVEDTGDEVVVRPVDGDVDKLLTALLRGAEAEAEAEAGA